MTIEVIAAGDLCIGGPVRAFDPTGGTLWSVIGGADLAIANLEESLTDQGVRADKTVTLRAHPSIIEEIARLRFRAVTLANNHMMDYGVEGLTQTLEVLDRAHIAHAGAGHNYAAAASATTLEAGGLDVALLSFASTVPTGAAATAYRAGIAPIRVTTKYVVDGPMHDENPGSAPYIATDVLETDVKAALDEIGKARDKHEFVIVGLHWGVPPEWMPPIQGALADYQRPLAHRIIDAGADLIVGGHAHAPHGVEVYRGKVIAYCLGNFVFHRLPSGDWDLDRPGPSYRDTSMRRVDFRFRAGCMLRIVAAVHRVERAELIPYRLDERAEPVASHGHDAANILETVRAASPDPNHLDVDGDVGLINARLLGADVRIDR